MERLAITKVSAVASTIISAVERRISCHSRRLLLSVFRKSDAWRDLQESRVRVLVKNQPTILFVCYGNICRSPFAERYMRKLLDRAISGHSIRAVHTRRHGHRPVHHGSRRPRRARPPPRDPAPG